jgi:pentatricopeptide repeat protein
MVAKPPKRDAPETGPRQELAAAASALLKAGKTDEALAVLDVMRGLRRGVYEEPGPLAEVIPLRSRR